MDGKQAVEKHEEGSEQGFEEADGLEESLLLRHVVKPTQEQLRFITAAATQSDDTGPEAWKEYQIVSRSLLLLWQVSFLPHGTLGHVCGPAQS
jgi:hypothetical protein